MKRVVLALVAWSGIAHADGELTARVGLGVAADEWGSGPVELDGPATFQRGGVLELELGMTIRPDLAMTVRSSITTTHDSERFIFCSDPFPGQDQTAPVQWRARTLGIGVAYAATERLWISPWIGVIAISLSQEFGGAAPMPAVGVDVGYDLLVWGHDRIGAFASAAHGGAFTADNSLDASPGEHQLAIGLAYRHW